MQPNMIQSVNSMGAASSACNIAVLDAALLGQNETVAQRLAGSRDPVLVRNAIIGQWRVGTEWMSLNGISQMHGSHMVRVGLGSYAGENSPEDAIEELTLRQVPLAEVGIAMRELGEQDAYVLANITNSHLEQSLPELLSLGRLTFAHKLLARLPFRADLEDVVEEAHAEPHVTRLAIGLAGSGVGFHTHGLALNAVFYGRKQWFIERPAASASASQRARGQRHAESQSSRALREARQAAPDRDGLLGAQSIARWFREDYAAPPFHDLWRADGFECVQHAGELVYVPSMLQHAVLNLEETFAIAMAMSSEL